jgi:hypothetical protein
LSLYAFGSWSAEENRDVHLLVCMTVGMHIGGSA